MVKSTEELDNIARKYNETKDKKYFYLWYIKVKEWSNGPNNIKRRVIPINPSVKADDGTYRVIRKPRLLRPMRYPKIKVNNVS
jgi:hypothetical protein